MNITIRLAELSDAQAIAYIHACSWEVAYKDIIPQDILKEVSAKRPAQWERMLSSENTIHYIMLKDGKTVGFFSVGAPGYEDIDNKNEGVDESFWELFAIYLHPDYYRQGIGSVAMEFAMNKAREAGKSNMYLWVFEQNINAIKFYEKCGFSADGAVKTYNYGGSKSVIRMRSPL